MKTIGAKQLRQELDVILDRVLGGEDIIVQHRFKGPVRLSAVHKTVSTSGRTPGLDAFEKASKKPSPFDPQKSIKELYHESLNRKYGA